MKHKIIIVAIACAFLSACSSPPKAPEPSGKRTPVNSPLIIKESNNVRV